jgi:hypothetical protein
MKALEHGYDPAKIHYRVKDREFYYAVGDEEFVYNAEEHRISPLFEYIPIVLRDPHDVNELKDMLTCVDVNPFDRFGKIFNHILHPDRNDPNDLIICDILLHILAYVDRICGMTKRDFQALLIIDEIEQGFYGCSIKNTFDLFNHTEKRAIAEALMMLYETQSCFRSIDALLGKIMPYFSCWFRDNEEVLFYTPFPHNEVESRKLQLIIDLLLPINLPYVVHWQYTYGVVEQESSMLLEKFVV